MAKVNHEIFEPNVEGLPIIYHVDRPTVHACPLNWHDALEILFCTEGEGRLLVDGRSVPFSLGEIAVINSNSIHGVTRLGEMGYHCIIIDYEFCKQNGIDLFELCFCDVIRSERIKSCYEQLVLEIKRAREERDFYTTLRQRSLLLEILCELCRSHAVKEGTVDGVDATKSRRVKGVIEYLRKNYLSELTLDDIARVACISKFHLAREFKEVTGQTVFGYINALRVTSAAKAIKAGERISDAGESAGFDNLSYFTRKFKEIMGKKPSEYRKQRTSRD